MKKLFLDTPVKGLLYWYIFIFFSTEILSNFKLLERGYILSGEITFWTVFLFFHRKRVLYSLRNINLGSKSLLFILILLLLTFIQGFLSAPSTTDSMVYHIPRVMYWIQEKTLFQDVIRNSHDYMAPFGEYILLHLYLIFGNDRMLFFSQWIAYVVSIYVIGLIGFQLGVSQKSIKLIRLFAATLPITVMQASSTQVDMVVTALLLICLHLSLFLKDHYLAKHSVLLGFVIALGFLTKATFAFYVLIPISVLFLSYYNKFKKSAFIIAPVLLIVIILQFRFISQNFLLYGNPLGVKFSEKGEEAVYINEVISPFSMLSNLTRNLFVHLPVPLFPSLIRNGIVNLHNLMVFDVNDSRITCCGTKFVVNSILYPQEDIVANPLHLILILAGGFFIIFEKGKLNRDKQVKVLYLSSIISFIVFSALIKWQPFHPRLEIPFFLVGGMSSIIILSQANKKRILHIWVALSGVLAIMIIILNVSRPYISYNLFYDLVKSFQPITASVPEAFYIKPREQQYFNARYYWYEPYIAITTLIAQKNNKDTTIAFDLPDGFEYPLWALMKKQNIKARIIPYSQIDDETVLVSSSVDPFTRIGYKTVCIESTIKYGYVCLSERIR